MSVAAACVWEVQPTVGNDANGGGYVSGGGGTDRSQQASAQVVIDNSTIKATSASSTITFTQGYTPSAADVGNVYQDTGANGSTAGFYQIIAQTSTTWTVSGTIGTSTGLVGKMGGALASIGKAGAAHAAGNTIYLKNSGINSVTSNVSNVAGGVISLTAGTAANATRLIGYNSSRGDNGTKPLIQASSINTFVLVTLAADCHLENVSIDGASSTSSRGVAGTTSSRAYRVQVKNCTNEGFNSCVCILCECTGCATTGAFVSATCFGCVADNNTTVGFNNCNCTDCLAVNNSGGSTDGFAAGAAATWINCSARGNGRAGFRATAGAYVVTCINCVADSNTGNNYDASAAFDGMSLISCAGYTSGTNVGSNITPSNNIGFITLNGTPFSNAGTGDYSLNNLSNQGVPCRNAGIPGSAAPYLLPGVSTNAYPDLGAAMHNGGTTINNIAGGILGG